MKRKVRKILFVIALIFASILITKTNKSLATETTVGDYTYTYDLVDGKAENVYISKYNGESFTRKYYNIEITIPSELDGYTVNSVGNGTNNVLGLTMEKTLADTVGGKQLSINKIQMPNTVKKISAYAFAGIEIELSSAISIPDGVTSIGDWAFANIHYSQAYNCLTIPNSVETIGNYAFANTYGPFEYTAQDPRVQGVNRLKWSKFPCGMYTIELGTGVKTIGNYAFCNQHYISNITIPSNVTSIGRGAFINCSASTLNISERTTDLNIGDYAFADSNINSISIKDIYKLGSGVFAHCGNLESATFQSGVVTIPDVTFWGCESLTDATVANTLKEIMDSAFYDCKKLTNESFQNITAQAEHIGSYAFFKCDGLTGNIVLNPTITSMGSYVFAQCDEIQSVDIRAELQAIPEGTFYSCDKLEDITKTDATTIIMDYAFTNCVSIDTEEYNDIVNNIVQIDNYVFSGCDGLTGEIVVPSIVTNLGKYVFSKCPNITSAKLMHNFSEIPDGTFFECTSLEDVTIQDSVTKIGKKAFENCTSISIDEYNDISRNVTEIGASAFENCTGISGVLHVKYIVTNIGDAAFKNCKNITEIIFDSESEITIPYESYKFGKTIGEQCFSNAAKNQEVVRIYSKGCGTKIGYRAFTNVREIFIDDYEARCNFAYKWWGEDAFKKPYIHYIDCKHYIDITSTIPGVRLVNPENDEVLSSDFCECESDYSFKVVIDEAYADKYENLRIAVVSEGKYKEDDLVTEYLEPENGKTYTLENVTRNKQIIVQTKTEGTDLVLRQYIYEKNGHKLIENRAPSIGKDNTGIETIKYLHSKYPVSVRRGDRITVNIRVYNEGKTEGQVNTLKYMLESGLVFVPNDPINVQYGWTLDEESNIITTDYLNDKPIEIYPGKGRPKYQEVQIVFEIDRSCSRDGFVTTTAEIKSGNDMDSADDVFTSAGYGQSLHEASMSSNKNSFIKFMQDNSDYEAVYINSDPKTGYSIVVNKIDSLSDELLNGAKIQLLDKDKNVVSEGITEDGTVTFSNIFSAGEGTDIYYLYEAETPIGYRKTIEDLIELQIIKTLNSNGQLDLTIKCDALDIDGEILEVKADVDDEVEFIPIYTEAQLAKIGSSEQITVDGHQYEFSASANYVLKNDIEITAERWTPITKMEGIFDGGNHTISNLNIDVANGTENIRFEGQENASGLFGNFAGEIRNLNISGSSITGETTGDNPGTGFFIGHTIGTVVIDNCNVNESSIDVTSYNVGGFVGHVNTGCAIKIKDSSNNANINAGYNIGGLIGCIKESSDNVLIDNCENTGIITRKDGQYWSCNHGGFIGYIGTDRNVEIIGSTNSGNIFPEYDLTVSTFMDNIGGFVGLADVNSQVKVKSSTNSAEIIKGKQNVGGIIGFSNGILSIIDCENSATISNNGYNCGGLIGHASPEGTARVSSVVGYDPITHTITVNIKNKETIGSYDLNIIKVCENDILPGAKFNVYDSDMNLLKENEEVNENGVLSISNIPINSLNSDIYFIKETEAPEGYNILINEYVKIEVTKTWDKESSKYIISQETTLVEDIEQVEIEEKEKAGTGVTVDPLTGGITYNNLKTLVMGSKNTGMVVTYRDNAGGMAGLIDGICVFENCENGGQVVATSNSYSGNAGGIAGQISYMHECDEQARILECKNSGNITGRNLGGMAGEVEIKIEVADCENTGNLTGSDNAPNGGMIGLACEDVYIHDCTTKECNISAGNAAGILADYIDFRGQSFRYMQNNVLRMGAVVIEDCIVNNVKIAGEGNLAGILAETTSDNNNINRCIVESSEITGDGDAAGILAHSGGEKIYSQDCRVSDCKILSAHKHAAGLVATANSYNWCFRGSDMWNASEIYLEDFILEGSEVKGSDDSAGVMGVGPYYSYVRNFNIYIGECSIRDYNEKHTTIVSGSGHAAGIFASVFCGSKDGNIRIEVCDVENATIETDASSGYQNGVSGIFGHIYRYDGNNESLLISDCNVKGCNFINRCGDAQTTSAGIYGTIMNSEITIEIDNCDVVDCNFDLTCGNAGGIVSYLWYYRTVDVYIHDCNTINTSFKFSGLGNTCGGIWGGMFTSSGSPKVSDCSVKGISIENAKLAGGVIGYISYTEIDLENIVVEKYVNEETGEEKENEIIVHASTTCAGGVIGGMYSTGEKLSYKNVICKDLTIKDGGQMRTYNLRAGGFIGEIWTISPIYMENIQIDNLNMKLYTSSLTNWSQALHVGGIAGMIYGHDVDVNNIKVSNADIETNGGDISGGFGALFHEANTSLRDIELKNIKLIEDDETVGVVAYYEHVGGLAALTLAWGDGAEVENVTVDNMKIKLNNIVPRKKNGEDVVGNIGGIFGNCVVTNMHNITVNNIDISATLYGNISDSSYDMNMAGVAGYYYIVSQNDYEFSDIHVKNVTIDNPTKYGTSGAIIAVSEDDERYWNGTTSIVNKFYNRITDSDVENVTIDGKRAVGGIVGCGRVNILNVTVKNPILTGNEASKDDNGNVALVGGAVGIAVEGSTIDDVTVTADLPEDGEDKQYGIFSCNIAGGIAAVDSGEIKNSSVENIIVKTLVKLISGEEVADEEVEPEIGETSTYPFASAVHTLFNDNYENCTINNVDVICGEE